MKLRLVKLGKVAYPEIRDLANMYTDRIKPFARIEVVEQRDPESGPADVPGQLLVTLDERGEELSSHELAQRLERWTADPAVKTLTIVVGGPLGLPKRTQAAADTRWCLSRATLTSDLAWLVCCEQLYRAYNIIKGTGYHHA